MAYLLFLDFGTELRCQSEPTTPTNSVLIHVLSGTWGMPQQIPCDALFMEYRGMHGMLGRFIVESLQYGELVQNHDTNRIMGMLNLSKHHAKAVCVFFGTPIVSQSSRNNVWLLEMGLAIWGRRMFCLFPASEGQGSDSDLYCLHPFQTR